LAENLVDSEVMIGQLKANVTSYRGAMRLTGSREYVRFIDPPSRTLVDTILEAARLSSDGKATRLVVAGCWSSGYRDVV